MLALGLGAIVLDLWRRAPKDVNVHFRWGEARHALRIANVRYEREGELMREATFRYTDGAPYQQPHTVRLMRGHYVVRVRLDYAEGSRRRRVPLEVGSQDEVTLMGPW